MRRVAAASLALLVLVSCASPTPLSPRQTRNRILNNTAKAVLIFLQHGCRF